MPELEPGPVGGALALHRPWLRVIAVPVKVAADKAGVVEHPVQHHPHPPAVGLPAQLGEVLVGPQHWVHPAVISCAVAVVLRRFEDGVEVQRLYPQGLEVVQLLYHAPQVAPEEVPVADLPVGVGSVLRLLLPALVDSAPPYQPRGVRHPGAAEAVGEDLVAHPLPEPAGHDLAPVVDGKLVLLLYVPAPTGDGLQLKGVPHQSHIVPSVQDAGEGIPPQIGVCPGQLHRDDLIVPLLQPGGELPPGVALRPQGAEGERHLGPGRDRSIGGFEPHAP